MLSRLALSLLLLLLAVTSAIAQTDSPPPLVSEEIEPRIIGRPGSMSVGIAGFVDKFSSSEDLFPANYVAQVDVCRFLTRRIAIRIGTVGTGSFGGEEDTGEPAGSGAPSIQLASGVLFYFTPLKMASLYVGGEYWAQITRRVAGDSGSLLGVAGIHAAVSSRASVFIQGGVGGRIARGDESELLTRIVAQLGVRLKL